MTDFEFTTHHRRHIYEVMEGRQVSPGKKVMEFERCFASYHDLKHGIMMNSGTDALRCALLALKEANGWKDGDKVLVPAVTFVATVNVVLQAGLIPVLVDVTPLDFGLNIWPYLSNTIELPTDTKALIVVHIGGQMADMYPIRDLARRRNLKIIEDSCETMFASYDGKPCGTWGDVGCFSTYAAHIMTTGAGGLACTNNDSLASLIRSYANHGRNTDYLPPHSRALSDEQAILSRFRFDRIGYSCRSTELDAAVGCGELDQHEESLARRQAVANDLRAALSGHQWLQLPEKLPGRSHSYMFFPLVIKDTAAGHRIDKRDLVLFLEREGIETRDLLPILRQPCYGSLFNEIDFPVARHLLDNAFYIPCHPGLSETDIAHIRDAFDRFSLPLLTK